MNRKEYLAWIMEAIDMPLDTRAAVMETEAALTDADFETFDTLFKYGGDCKQYDKDLAEQRGLNRYVVHLTNYLSYSARTRAEYQKRGIDEQIFIDSMTDFTVWERACRDDKGSTGVNELGWLWMTLTLRLFRLGRFQYEPRPYKMAAVEVGGQKIEGDVPMLNVHIPEGSPMTPEARLDSYRRAVRFFSDYGKTPAGQLRFMCHSWLLYPAHRDFLPPTSNIIGFMDDFKIVESGESPKISGDMWRIFGHHADFEHPEKLPEKTGLQRAYKKHLIETGCTGFGLGVFLYDGTDFVKE